VARLSLAVAAITTANGVGMVITALAMLYVVRMLGVTEYGRLVYFLGVLAILRVLGSLGLNSRLLNDIPGHTASNRLEQLSRCFYSLLGMRIFTASLILGVGYVAATLDNNILLFYAGLAATSAVLRFLPVRAGWLAAHRSADCPDRRATSDPRPRPGNAATHQSASRPDG
jgi:O-antigen/teichoic acid export membrane protein